MRNRVAHNKWYFRNASTSTGLIEFYCMFPFYFETWYWSFCKALSTEKTRTQLSYRGMSEIHDSYWSLAYKSKNCLENHTAQAQSSPTSEYLESRPLPGSSEWAHGPSAANY